MKTGWKQIVMRKGQKIPVKIWTNDYVEESCLEQAVNLGSLPFAFKHICLMPDTHMGYGMPIGGVLATEGVVIPNAVGVDIGCGMTAIQTNLNIQDISTDSLKSVLSNCRKIIPVGKKHRQSSCYDEDMPEMGDVDRPIVHSQYDSAKRQMGTLGGGNHFIEFQKDQYNTLWVMVHSGSRNLGHKVATHYNKLAKSLNKLWTTSVPESWQLSFLPMDTDEGRLYLREMEYCVEFANLNREFMLSLIKGAMRHQWYFDVERTMNVSHNFAAMEHHYGKNVLVHRKGATPAKDNQWCIIPGSQGTASYIGLGRGCIESFKSCSHGAGRVHSRRSAKENLSLKNELQRMEEQGIIHGIRGVQDLDEAPGAYKNIESVMDNQKDLVEIQYKLKPLAVIKG